MFRVLLSKREEKKKKKKQKRFVHGFVFSIVRLLYGTEKKKKRKKGVDGDTPSKSNSEDKVISAIRFIRVIDQKPSEK